MLERVNKLFGELRGKNIALFVTKESHCLDAILKSKKSIIVTNYKMFQKGADVPTLDITRSSSSVSFIFSLLKTMVSIETFNLGFAFSAFR